MMDQATIEQQYNARAAVPDHPRIFTRWRQDAALARRTTAGLMNLAYGDELLQTLDFFPARQESAPLLVFIHGGYWRSLDKADFSWVAPPFVQRGCAVACLNYSLAPTVSIEQIVHEVLNAIQWLHARSDQYGFDPSKIYIAGHSAGAHLCAMLLAALWPQINPALPTQLIQGAVLVSGLYDLAPLVHAPFVNQDLKLDSKSAYKLSPIHMPPAACVPVVTAVGALESDEFQRQTGLIEQAWGQLLPVERVALPLANHLTACDELANTEHPLFEAACRVIGLAK